MAQAKKTILITGGSEGIGAACVELFHKKGYNVAHISNSPTKKFVSADILEFSGDITDAKARENCVNETLKKFGQIDILLNNAGVSLYSQPSESEADFTRRVFDVNYMAVMQLTQLVLPHILARGTGSIANVGSIAGYVAMPWAASYCASKAAVHSWNDSLYRELRRTKIHVMKICPGIVDTNIRNNVIAGNPPQSVLKIKTVASPENMARAIYNGLKRKRRTVYYPLIGIPFILVDYFLPFIMDIYLDRKSKN